MAENFILEEVIALPGASMQHSFLPGVLLLLIKHKNCSAQPWFLLKKHFRLLVLVMIVLKQYKKV